MDEQPLSVVSGGVQEVEMSLWEYKVGLSTWTE